MSVPVTARLSMALLVVMLQIAAIGCGGNSTHSSGSAGEEASGDQGIQEFGSEAVGRDRSALVATFHLYLGDLSAENYSDACSYLSTSLKRSLEDLVPKRVAGRGCEGILPGILAPGAPAFSREQAHGKIVKARVQGDHAFLVYHAPGADLYELRMVLERARWRADAVAGSVLVPFEGGPQRLKQSGGTS